ncbi:MAG: hypothetical protein J6U55_02375 [Bacteroidaceae bacterium]|nr:hypothetical protein [Bacteroidaceae bacterium]MBQ5776935.1 hypothetical protein [Bacteroidaceae bacterium]MBR5002097.1 hypothetical protein [Bacteroidaceae bacterium]
MSKEKFILEYDFKQISPTLLWDFISTAPLLEEWFADKVECNEKEYTFYWNKVPQVAHLVNSRVGVFVRFHWADDATNRTSFEMRITTSELTGDTMLSVTDYADNDELEDLQELWNNEIERLQRRLGVL